LTDFSKEIKEKTHKNKQSSGPEKKKAHLSTPLRLYSNLIIEEEEIC